MSLTTCQKIAQWITQRINAYMDLGAEPSPASAEGLGCLSAVFLGAPAAQEWARTIVLSIIKCSMSGSAMKWECICSQMPLSHQRANRLYTLFHLPYCSGSSRHCAPLRVTHKTPSTNRRQSASWPTYTLGHARRKLSIFDHCSSGSLIAIHSIIHQNVNRT